MRQTSTISTSFLFNCAFNLHLLAKKASGHDLAELLSFHLHPYLRKFAAKKRLYRTDSPSPASLEMAWLGTIFVPHTNLIHCKHEQLS